MNWISMNWWREPINVWEQQVSMELEHAIGFSGNLRKCLFFHPNGRDISEFRFQDFLLPQLEQWMIAVYAAGGCVVVADLSDPHNQVWYPTCRPILFWTICFGAVQVFLRGHDNNISCLTLSSNGRWYLDHGRHEMFRLTIKHPCADISPQDRPVKMQTWSFGTSRRSDSCIGCNRMILA